MNKLVDRNLKGTALEKEGKEKQAVLLYEANIRDCFDGSHPYNRLRVIYMRREEYTSALRVCEAYIRNCGYKEGEKYCDSFRFEMASFERRIKKLKEKIGNK